MKEFPLFSQRLRETRIKMGLTQAELAKLTGATPATISAYEKGKSPSLEIVSDIAQQLNVSIDYLLGIDKDKEKIYNPFNSNPEEIYKNLITAIGCVHLYGLSNRFHKYIGGFRDDLHMAMPILDDKSYEIFIKQGIIESLLKKHITIFKENSR